MKRFLFIILSALIFSCSSTEDKTNDAHIIAPNTNAETAFDRCFPLPDSTFVQSVVGCAGGAYKVISDHYVLRISTDSILDYGDCLFLIKDTIRQDFNASLFIFKKGDAGLTNICTDIIDMNAPEPIQVLKDCAGSITIGQSDPTDYYGNEMPKTSIIVHKLVFKNDKTGENILIEDELFYKVLNLGMPG